MPPRFFIDAPLAVSTAPVALPATVAHHAIRVLRLAVGDTLVLFNGQGGEFHARVVVTDRREASVQIERFDPIERESPLAVTLVQAILATDAMDYAVRKAVELGASAIQPIIAARSQFSRVADREGKRLAHWRGIAIAACEQCGRNRIPPVAAPLAFDVWLQAPRNGPTVIAGAGASLSLVSLIARKVPSAILIGPEGGFTDAELSRAQASGIEAVHLGPRVLRAETAGLAALAMLNALVGDGC